MPGGIIIDEAGEPVRTGGGPSGGFTGGGGGGPGGGSFGFGGGGFGVAFAPQGRPFAGVGPQRKRIPGVTPGAPMPSDTAMVAGTPGELMMNNGVTQNPQLALALALLNHWGSQQMGQRAQGPQMSQGPQMPQGLALGGFVQQPGMNRWQSTVRGMQQAPKGGMQPLGGPTPAPQTQGGYQYNPEGGVTGGYNPNDPYGAYTQNRDTRTYGQGTRDFGAFGQAGYFDPNGNQALLNSVRQEALSNARAQQQGAGLRAQLAGMDPGAAASYKLEAGLRGSSDVARALSSARYGAMQSQQDFAQSLYDKLLSGDLGFTGADQQMKLQDYLANQASQRAKKNQWGNIAGQVLGAGVGAYFGGRP